MACPMTENRRRPTSERPKRPRPMRSMNGVSGRIGNEAPVEMTRVAEELEFVAMKAVAAVGGDVQDCGGNGNADDGKKTRCGRLRAVIALGVSDGDCGHTKVCHDPSLSSAYVPAFVLVPEFSRTAGRRGPMPFRQRLRPGCRVRCLRRQGSLQGRRRASMRQAESRQVRACRVCSLRRRRGHRICRADRGR